MAEVWWQSEWPAQKRTDVTNAYWNNYRTYDAGYDYLPESSFYSASIAFSQSSTASWARELDWTLKNLADQPEFRQYTSDISIVARCIYAENTNALYNYADRQRQMRATTDVITNRARYTSYGGTTYTGVILKAGAFSAMRDGNIGTTNPIYHSGDLDAWCYAVFIANHLYSSIEPWGKNQELSANYFHFFDTHAEIPFFIYSGGVYTRVPRSNIPSASHYRPSGASTYYRITATPVLLGYTAYFSY